MHKRYTYSFQQFIFGNYHLKQDKQVKDINYSVESLLEQMTTEELLDIWSLNFEQLWYRLCLNVNKQDVVYNKKYSKFQLSFMQDGGKQLQKLIENTRSRGTLLWEVPKGRKDNNRESDISCAIREVEEETSIKKQQYIIIPEVRKKISFISCGVRYVCIYFIAMASAELSKSNIGSTIYQEPPSLQNIDKMQEVSEVRWYNIQYLRLFDNGNKRLESLISPAFTLVKKYIKNQLLIK